MFIFTAHIDPCVFTGVHCCRRSALFPLRRSNYGVRTTAFALRRSNYGLHSASVLHRHCIAEGDTNKSVAILIINASFSEGVLVTCIYITAVAAMCIIRCMTCMCRRNIWHAAAVKVTPYMHAHVSYYLAE